MIAGYLFSFFRPIRLLIFVTRSDKIDHSDRFFRIKHPKEIKFEKTLGKVPLPVSIAAAT